MKLGVQSRFAAQEKCAVLELVEAARTRTGWTLRRILMHLGLSKGCYHEWRKPAAQEGRLTDRSTAVLSGNALLQEERRKRSLPTPLRIPRTAIADSPGR